MPNLIKKIREAGDFVSLGAASYEQILSAEMTLNLVFANDFKEYLRAFGAATFNSKELTGIGSSERLSVISVTNRARSYFENFPKDAYVIEELHFDHIITIQKPDGTVYSYCPNNQEEKLADTLYEYLFTNSK